MQDRFADGLAGNGTGVDGGSADDFQLFDECRPLAKFRRLNCSPLAAGSGTNHDEIVLFHGSPREYTTVAIVESLLTRAERSAIILRICLGAIWIFESEKFPRGERSACGFPYWRQAARATSHCSRPSGPASSLTPVLASAKHLPVSRPSKEPSSTSTASSLPTNTPIIATACRKCSASGKRRSTLPNLRWGRCSAFFRTLWESVSMASKPSSLGSISPSATSTCTPSPSRMTRPTPLASHSARTAQRWPSSPTSATCPSSSKSI